MYVFCVVASRMFFTAINSLWTLVFFGSVDMIKDEWWEGLNRSSEEYRKKKEEAADFLWQAISEYIPNAKDRAVPGTVQIGTPLTHERFLRRTRGAYGPRVDVSQGQTLPGHTTPLQGFLCVATIHFLPLVYQRRPHRVPSQRIPSFQFGTIGKC
jgi:hypothetical protein